MITVHPVPGIGEVRPGSDLADLLAAALFECTPVEGDILVVTSKVVSKAEGRFRQLSDVTPDAEAQTLAEITAKDPRLVELVLAESQEVVRAARHVLITRHRLGLVMANAGIDASNIGSADTDTVLLLPEDPDNSARLLSHKLSRVTGVRLPVLLSDSFGRPWRVGVTNVAVGAAGLPALIDRRGGYDRDGRSLEVTQTAIGDLLASAAGLVMGEGAESIPAVLVRGCAWDAPERAAAALVRPMDEDLFR